MNRTRSAALGGIIAAGFLLLSTPPASAHHPIVSGESSCDTTGHQQIKWTATNSESVTGTNRSMTIDAVSIDRGNLPFSVGQTFPPTPLPASTQDGTSSYGGAETGDVILTVRVDFSGDGPQNVERLALVELVGGCTEATTTTTAATTTSTAPATTTTTTAATVIAPATTTTLPAAVLGTTETLPRTGFPLAFYAAVGLLCLFVGAAALAVRRLERPSR